MTGSSSMLELMPSGPVLNQYSVSVFHVPKEVIKTIHQLRTSYEPPMKSCNCNGCRSELTSKTSDYDGETEDTQEPAPLQ